MFTTFEFLADWVLAWHQLFGRGNQPPRAPGGMLGDIFTVELRLFLLGPQSHKQEGSSYKNEIWPRENPPWCRGAWQSQEIWVIKCMTLYLIVEFCMSFSFLCQLTWQSISSVFCIPAPPLLVWWTRNQFWGSQNQFTTGPQNCS